MGLASRLLNPMSSSESFHFPKLNGENYAIWSEHMQAVLQAKQLWLVVTGDKSSPEKPAETKPGSMSAADYKTKWKEYLKWLLRDQAAQGLMESAAENTQWPHVKGKKTSKEMWDAWKALHITNNQRINVHYHFEDLYTWKYVDDTNMADHVASMLDLRHKILAAGEDLSDIHVAQALVLSLP